MTVDRDLVVEIGKESKGDNGERIEPVNANNVAPPPLNGARKSIEELVNQVSVHFEEMLARA